ncbi:MAG: HAD family hydrolase [Actinomycetaceae bacterium]|nr:HAD family hydrolase [Actinomycetaceae bacterium]
MERLVFIDVDGTLLDRWQRVPESARHILPAIARAGHGLMLATGRSLPEIYPWIWDLGFSGIIAGSGAYVRVGSEVVADERIARRDIEEVSAELDRLGVLWLWQSPEGMWQAPGFMDVFVGDGSRWGDYERLVRPSLADGLPDSASKGTFVIPADAGVSVGDLAGLFGARFKVIAGSSESSSGTAGEILIRGADKGSGLLQAASYAGVPVEHTIAIGDSSNDLQILSQAGLGVAMGNGADEVKAVADLVTSSVDDDGLAEALIGLGLVPS